MEVATDNEKQARFASMLESFRSKRISGAISRVNQTATTFIEAVNANGESLVSKSFPALAESVRELRESYAGYILIDNKSKHFNTITDSMSAAVDGSLAVIDNVKSVLFGKRGSFFDIASATVDTFYTEINAIKNRLPVAVSDPKPISVRG